jgi:hypothetical protein
LNPETKLQNRILLALSDAGCTVWRNETAGAWMGKQIHREGDQVTLTNARMMTFGLCVGSSDIIGLTPSGTFLAIEVKTPKGCATKDQLRFIDAVNSSGGIAGVARSVEDALELVRRG